MAQGVLPFQYQDQKQAAGLTALAGCPLILTWHKRPGCVTRSVAMKHLVLPQSWGCKRLKAIRFGLINLAGQVRACSRQLQIPISPKQPAYTLLLQIRERIAHLAREGPPVMDLTG